MIHIISIILSFAVAIFLSFRAGLKWERRKHKDCVNYSYCIELQDKVKSLEEANKIKNEALEAKIPETLLISKYVTGISMYEDMQDFGARI